MSRVLLVDQRETRVGPAEPREAKAAEVPRRQGRGRVEGRWTGGGVRRVGLEPAGEETETSEPDLAVDPIPETLSLLPESWVGQDLG